MKFTFLSLICLCSMHFTYAQDKQQEGQIDGQKTGNLSGQKGITVFPARLVFNLDKGQSASKVLNIGNFTNEKYQLVMDFRDWTRDTTGKHIYTPGGSSPQSCAGWVTFDKSIIELAPGQSSTVTVTLKVPDHDSAVSEMKWTMAVIRSAHEKRPPTKGARLETIVEESFGIGVHILQTPPNINNKELRMISFSKSAADPMKYRVICKNVGGVELLAKFSLELSSNETGKKTSLDPVSAPLFPRQSRYVDFLLPADLPKGKYTAIALVDAEDDSVPIEAAEEEIEIK